MAWSVTELLVFKEKAWANGICKIQQCLCAPTRGDIDHVHSRGKWLDTSCKSDAIREMPGGCNVSSFFPPGITQPYSRPSQSTSTMCLWETSPCPASM